MNTRIHRALGLSLVLAAPVWGAVPTPLLEFLFNDSGTTTSSTGSATLVGTMRNSAGTAADLHGIAGSGVSGSSGDLAFNNSASTAMGSAGVGGRVSAGTTSISTGLTSFTVTGWFKSDTVLSGGANLISNFVGGASGTGFRVRAADSPAGVLLLGVNGTEVSSSIVSWNATGEWVFFAVSYDGTATSANVRFYVGDTDTSVTLKSTQTLNMGSVSASSADFTLGNLAGQIIRPYDGLLDSFRLFGATSGTGGVLSLSQLEEVRFADVTAIPEPSSIAVFLGASVLMGTALRRRPHARA